MRILFHVIGAAWWSCREFSIAESAIRYRDSKWFPSAKFTLELDRSGGEWDGEPRSLCTSLGSCHFPIPSFFWPPFLCADPPYHTDTYPDEIAPKIAGKDLEYESRGRRATNPDFIVRERVKGKTWVWGQGCYIVKQKELMGRIASWWSSQTHTTVMKFVVLYGYGSWYPKIILRITEHRSP